MKTLLMILIIIAAVSIGVMINKTDDSQSSAVNGEAEANRERNIVASEKDMLVSIYDGVNVSRDMVVLNLAHRSFSGSLKAEVNQLNNLRELNISHNNFTGLPAEIGQLASLEVLNLSYNPLTGLPHELGNLKNLKQLDLRGTNYSAADLVVITKALPPSTEILRD